MKRRVSVALLFGLALCVLLPVQAFADDWEVWVPDPEVGGVPPDAGLEDVEISDVDGGWTDEEWLVNDLASDSDATPSDAGVGGGGWGSGVSVPAPLSSYEPYDSSISTSVLQYMSDVLPKLGNVRYVLFRSGQYTYRLVYADDMDYSGNVFTADDADYVAYNSRDYTWTTGREGTFRLTTRGYHVYSDLGMYPLLDADSIYVVLIAFVGVVFLLFTIYRSLLAPGRFIL